VANTSRKMESLSNTEPQACCSAIGLELKIPAQRRQSNPSRRVSTVRTGTQGLCGPTQIECASSKGLFDGHPQHQLGRTVFCEPRSSSCTHMLQPVGCALLTWVSAIDIGAASRSHEEWYTQLTAIIHSETSVPCDKDIMFAAIAPEPTCPPSQI